MITDKVKLKEFQTRLDALLDEFGYELIVGPMFIDKLGNKHPITVGEITAELQVKEKTDAKPATE